MKSKFLALALIAVCAASPAFARTSPYDSSGFVMLSEAVPDAILEIRYYSTYNFVGERIDGYEAPVALLTKEAAKALREVSDELVSKGYRLKIFDAYRPQKAVNHFERWARDLNDTKMKEYFYPKLNKDVLFDQGYISHKSGHSRGSTVDLTLFDMKTEKEVDMGGTFDYFGRLSHPDYKKITKKQYENRMLLREVMTKHGFKPLSTEWWHFTLKDEPYPHTYFAFPVKELAKENEQEVSDLLFQAALLQSLMNGGYDGFITVGELKKYGDTGIGTFQGVNGEMIAVDGEIYRAKHDGSVEVAPNDETVPFCNVTFFDSDLVKENVTAGSFAQLREQLDAMVNAHGKNQFYMAKITGKFPKMHARSEIEQKKPYRTLDVALRTDQREFKYDDIDGTVVALYCPDYAGGLNSKGWHMHFVSEEKDRGGHVLELACEGCTVEMDIMSGINMIIPDTEDFNASELSVNMDSRIREVEGGE